MTNRQQSSLTSWKHKTPRTQTPPGFVETRAVRASTGLGGSPHPSDPATAAAAAAAAAAPPPAFVTRSPPSPTPLPIWPIPESRGSGVDEPGESPAACRRDMIRPSGSRAEWAGRWTPQVALQMSPPPGRSPGGRDLVPASRVSWGEVSGVDWGWMAEALSGDGILERRTTAGTAQRKRHLHRDGGRRAPLNADMSVNPKVGSMIPEDLSTKDSNGSMIQSDLTVKFDSGCWISLDPLVIFGMGSWIPSDPRCNWWNRIYDPRKSWIQADPSHISGCNYAISG